MKSMASRTATARRLETTTAAISQLAVADPEDPALCIRGSALGVYGSAYGGEVYIQSWAKNVSLGCENFLPGPAWLLLSKTGPP